MFWFRGYVCNFIRVFCLDLLFYFFGWRNEKGVVAVL
nr:unnamed protein product [Callosobruchus analis]